MRKFCILILVTVVIWGTYLTACSRNDTHYKTASETAQMPPIEPGIPTMPDEVPDSSGISDIPSPNPSESHTEPKDSGTISSSTAGGEQSVTETAPIPQANVDIDLTRFSANVLYAEIYNMGMSPEHYRGKVIKLTGEFAHFPKAVDENGNPTSDEEIYVCMITDALACCAAGIEFIPEKGSSFWSNRPEVGSKITVTGLCDIFLDESGWYTIIQLDNAAVEQSN